MTTTLFLSVRPIIIECNWASNNWPQPCSPMPFPPYPPRAVYRWVSILWGGMILSDKSFHPDIIKVLMNGFTMSKIVDKLRVMIGRQSLSVRLGSTCEIGPLGFAYKHPLWLGYGGGCCIHAKGIYSWSFKDLGSLNFSFEAPFFSIRSLVSKYHPA